MIRINWKMPKCYLKIFKNWKTTGGSTISSKMLLENTNTIHTTTK